MCTQCRDTLAENLVYSVEAGVKGTWSGKALKRSYLAWDFREDGSICLGSQRRPLFQAKDNECAMAPSLIINPCVWRIQTSSLLLKNKF